MTVLPTLMVSRRSQTLAISLILIGCGAAIYGLRTAPQQAWPHLLLDSFYLALLGLAALFFLVSQRVTGARWSAALRRIPESIMLLLPGGSVLIIALFFGADRLFPWMQPGFFAHAPAIAGKVSYLRPSGVFARTIISLALWTGFCLLMRRTSLQQDGQPERNLELHRRLVNSAVCFTPIFAITFTLFVFDWIISLEPNWFSTMFAIYLFAGTFVQGIAAVTLAAVVLQRGPMREVVSEHHLHDLGKMLFAFSTFWAYIWVCQYLLIWYGNLPEEITHYVTRTSGPWGYLFALNFIMNWIVPFTLLLSIPAKRSVKMLLGISSLLLIGHWLDLYLLIMPSFMPAPRMTIWQLLIAAGFGGVVYLSVVWALGRARLVPVNDPVLVYEELHKIDTEDFAMPHSFGVKP
jgi:hypothetical protein